MQAEDILKGDPTAISLVFSEIAIAFGDKIREMRKKRYLKKLIVRVQYTTERYRNARDEIKKQGYPHEDYYVETLSQRETIIANPKSAY